MNNGRKTIITLALIMNVGVNNAWAECDGVLRDGLFRTESIKSNMYLKQQFAARVATMTKADAEKSIRGGITLPIFEIPLGGAYTDSQFESWRQTVNSSTEFQSLLQQENQFLLSVADKTITDAWLGCVTRGGLHLGLNPKDATTVYLTLKWYQTEGGPSTIKIQGDVTPEGATVHSGGEHLRDGAELSVNERVVTLHRAPNAAVSVVVNTTATGKSVYLPKILELPPVPQPPVNRLIQSLMEGRLCMIKFAVNNGDDTLGTIARNAPYSITYNRNDGTYTVTGHAAFKGTRTHADPGPSPTEKKFAIWGAVFRLSDDGIATSTKNSSGNRKFVAPLLCN